MIFPYLFSDSCLLAYLEEEFTDRCLKSTPTPEFLLNLGRFDMSLILYNDMEIISDIMEILDAAHSGSLIPEFIVWLHQHVSPESICSATIESEFMALSSAAQNGRTTAFTFMWTYGLPNSSAGL